MSRYKTSRSASYGQKDSHCAGVAIATLALSFTGKISVNCTALGQENFNELVNEINLLSAKFYEMGLVATKDDFQHDIEPAVDSFIEIGSIRDGVTIDGRNIIRINESLAMTILPPWNVPLINNDQELLDYIEIWIASEFPDIFRRFMNTRTNAIVMFESHYVTILQFDQQFLLVNGLPQFSFRMYDSIDALIKDLIENVGETKFVLMHARKYSEHTLDCRKNDENVIVLDSRSSSSDEDLYSSDEGESNNEKKRSKENRLKVKNAVDPSEVQMLETTVRQHIEKIIREKMEAKGQTCEVAAISDQVCRAIGCHFVKTRHDLCIFHSRMLSFMLSITSGRLCETLGCERKATSFPQRDDRAKTHYK